MDELDAARECAMTVGVRRRPAPAAVPQTIRSRKRRSVELAP